MSKLVKCADPRGITCFACDRWGRCICLSDSRQVPCPFFKTKAQVLESDPHYYDKEVCFDETNH